MSTTTTTTTSSTSSTTTTQPPGYISRALGNPSLLQLNSGDIFLFYDRADEVRDDGSVIANIYETLSSNNGVTWTEPDKVTGYATWGSSGYHPEAVEREDGTINLSYHEENNVLSADVDTILWQNECVAPERSGGTDLHFDPVTSRLYIYQIHTYVGMKNLCGIIVFDTTTWEIIRVYTTTSAPGYNQVFKDQHVWPHSDHREAKYVVVSTFDYRYCIVMVINDNLETITNYVFKDSATYHLTTNIDIDWKTDRIENGCKIYHTWVDADNDRLYVIFGYSYLYDLTFIFGYIDLTEAFDPVTEKYTWNEILYTDSIFVERDFYGFDSIYIIPELNYLILCVYHHGAPRWAGKMTIVDILSGGIVKEYKFEDDPSFPWYGIRYPEYYNGHIYASFWYNSLDGQENYRGLVDINIETDVILYHKPTWATHDDYQFEMKKHIGNGKIAIAANDYGVTVFDTVNGSWELYDNDTLPGFEPTSYDPCVRSVEYDEVNNLILCGSTNSPGNSFAGIRGFSEDGALNQGKYHIGALTTDWDFGNALNLTQGMCDYDISIAITSLDIIWATWTRRDETEYSLKWDRDVADLDLTEYLVAGSSVIVNWSVDSKNKLTFKLSHGHLFDPNNTLSAFNPFLQKGRKITLQFGEKINDIEYWQNQGSYIISSTKLSYKRGSYPIISVGCEDISIIWDSVKIVASDRYDGDYPEDIVTDLLIDFVHMGAGDIDIPNLDNRHEIHYQWIEEDFTDMISELLDHFGYITYIDMDDKFTVKQITVNGSVDHVYTGSEIIDFSPDDNYSSFTNRVTVKGESLYFVEVLYPEEMVSALAGSGGWWSSKNKVERIYYSEDKQRKARYPRLHVIVSISDFEILWMRSGGTESITGVDPNEYWVEVTIEYPGLMGALLGAIALLLVIGVYAIWCDEEMYCGPMIMLFSVATSAMAYLLGQVATYEYEIWAQPIGEEKQTIYADADDIEFQRHLNGQIVNEEIDDAFCYTVDSCQIVADQEMDIVKAQRKRIKFKKIAHLQDEICDKIQINHPYSDVVMDIFITNLQRIYRKAKPGFSKSDSFIDNITGWRV